MLFGLNGDPYSYDDITDNPWLFKTKNKGKENEYVCKSIFKNCLPTSMMRPSDDIIFTIIKFNLTKFYYKFYLFFNEL
jgi:hypothetical protein